MQIFLQSLTTHQFHLLLRFILAVVVFLGCLTILTFISNPNSKKKKQPPMQIFNKNGWRLKTGKRKKRMK